jgi:spore coat protein U-like protein
MLAVILGIAVPAAGGSLARNGSTEFAVSATVVDNCVVSSKGIAFGIYDPGRASAATAQGSITAKCTRGDAVSVSLNQGLHPGAGSTPAVPLRRMASGSRYLPYHIYLSPPPGNREWGSGTPGRFEPAPQVAAAVSAPLIFTTYGWLPPGINVDAGQYVDIVTATVTF